MDWHIILGVLIGFVGTFLTARFSRKRWQQLQRQKMERESTFESEMEKIEREVREKSLSDNIDRVNELLNTRERQKP